MIECWAAGESPASPWTLNAGSGPFARKVLAEMVLCPQAGAAAAGIAWAALAQKELLLPRERSSSLLLFSLLFGDTCGCISHSQNFFSPIFVLFKRGGVGEWCGGGAWDGKSFSYPFGGWQCFVFLSLAVRADSLLGCGYGSAQFSLHAADVDLSSWRCTLPLLLDLPPWSQLNPVLNGNVLNSRVTPPVKMV